MKKTYKNKKARFYEILMIYDCVMIYVDDRSDVMLCFCLTTIKKNYIIIVGLVFYAMRRYDCDVYV